MELIQKGHNFAQFVINFVPTAKVYAVGGFVRDMLLGITPKDLDIEVYGIEAEKLHHILYRYAETVKASEPKLLGAQFQVYSVNDLEVSLPRRESKVGDKHRSFVIQGDSNMTFAEGASRRDFTINAIGLNLVTGEFLDPYNGRADLRAGILRHVGPAFAEDPLRVLRGAQFISRFNLQIVDPATIEMCKSLNPNDLSMERIGGEFQKLLVKGDHPELGLKFLSDVGWFKYWFEGKYEDEPAIILQRAKQVASKTAHEHAFMVAVVVHTYYGSRRLNTLSCNTGRIEEPALELYLYYKAIEDCDTISKVRQLAHKLKSINIRILCDFYFAITGITLHACLQFAQKAGVLDNKLPYLIQGRDLQVRGVIPGPIYKKIIDEVHELVLEGYITNQAEAYAWLCNRVQQLKQQQGV